MIICRMTLQFIFIKNNMNKQIIPNIPTILVRVDATKEVALGHLKRCISLACKLKEKGVAVLFLTKSDDFAERFLGESGFNFISVESAANSGNDCDFALKTAERINAKIIVIDSYEIDEIYIKRLMNSGLFVISIDDIADKNIPSHVIINGNLNAEYLRYSNIDGASMYLGIRYLILSPDFWNPGRAADKDNFDNVLITMGGIDHYDLTSKILSVLDNFDFDFDVTAIIGPYYNNLDSIKMQAGRMKKKVDLVESPPSLFPYMRKCSMAFSAGGQTLYELAALGRPMIGITVWENQAGNVSELSRIGAIIGITYKEGKDFSVMLGKSTRRLIYDKTERQRLSSISSSLVDGKGAERACKAIFEAYKKWNSKECGRRIYD
jgi:UDP-2,4-diacetamido-2,4,6-trideoxy-beta-L-altropyranose hydrolase